MNINDILRQMSNQQQEAIDIPEDKIKLFCDRCYSEKDYTPYSLAIEIQQYLNTAPMISLTESLVYPKILQYLANELNKEKK